MFKLFSSVLSKDPMCLKEGRWKEFNKHGILISVGHYSNGLKHGHWKEYYDSGELMIEEHYQHGIQHGEFKTYHPNGKIMSEGIYENGKREGYFKVYNEDGVQTKALQFINDILHRETELLYP